MQSENSKKGIIKSSKYLNNIYKLNQENLNNSEEDVQLVVEQSNSFLLICPSFTKLSFKFFSQKIKLLCEIQSKYIYLSFRNLFINPMIFKIKTYIIILRDFSK